ncbi:MAG TPA: capsid cement protein [Nocardioidaceae bacterium]|nr:capsid cement protein [Nocardioidaceae bacterium]
MANDAIPFFDDGDELTCTAPAGVSGKTFVKISGDKQDDGTYTIATAAAGDRALGVAAWDAAAGKRVTVQTIDSGLVMPVVASGALAADDPVAVAAGGLAIKAAAGALAVGYALTSAADGADAEIKLSYFTA